MSFRFIRFVKPLTRTLCAIVGTALWLLLSACLPEDALTRNQAPNAENSRIASEARALANIAVLAQSALVREVSWFTSISEQNELDLAAIGVQMPAGNPVKSQICPSTDGTSVVHLTWQQSLSETDYALKGLGQVAGAYRAALAQILPSENIGSYNGAGITLGTGQPLAGLGDCDLIMPIDTPMIVFRIKRPARPTDRLSRSETRSLPCGEGEIGTVLQTRIASFSSDGRFEATPWSTELYKCSPLMVAQTTDLPNAPSAPVEPVSASLTSTSLGTAEVSSAIQCPTTNLSTYTDYVVGYATGVTPASWTGSAAIERADKIVSLAGSQGTSVLYKSRGRYGGGNISCRQTETAQITCANLWPGNAGNLIANTPFRFTRTNTITSWLDAATLTPAITRGSWTLASAGDCRWRQPDATCTRPESAYFSTQNSWGGSCGGYQCACTTPGALWTPYQPSADAICRAFGYDSAASFTTTAGWRWAYQCGAGGGGCFVNQNPGNIICSSVTCTRNVRYTNVSSPVSVSYTAGFRFSTPAPASCR